MSTYPLFAMSWTEYERGWGQRPDGYTFHASVEEFDRFLKDFYARLPQQVPDEYSKPDASTPFVLMVSESLYNYVLTCGSVWLSDNNKEAYTTYDASPLHARKKTP